MSLVRLNIKGISYSQTQNGAYALILSEENGDRKLPIVIGAFEAQSIAIALEKEIMPPRPLTHDLFKTFATMKINGTTNTQLAKVIYINLLSDPSGQIITIIEVTTILINVNSNKPFHARFNT